MASAQQRTHRERRPHHKERVTVRLPLTLIQYLRQWAARKDVPVSAVVEAAITKLSEELRTERRKKFQKAKAKKENL